MNFLIFFLRVNLDVMCLDDFTGFLNQMLLNFNPRFAPDADYIFFAKAAPLTFINKRYYPQSQTRHTYNRCG